MVFYLSLLKEIGGRSVDVLTSIETPEVLKEINIVSVSLRVMLAMTMGGILGFERGIKKRPAGLRTYMLVCISAAMVMITNQYMYQAFHPLDIDPSRLGAQVISGIGFLGAGTIIVTKRNQIKGLTTAAGLWAAACLGLTIGIGFYMGSVIGGAAIFIAMVLLQKADEKIRMGGKLLDVYVEFNDTSHVSTFINFLQKNDLELQDLSMNKGQVTGKDNVALILTLKLQKKKQHAVILQQISQAEGIQFIEEI
jgi:putative Mg2+ transporter-C (MgtC) family protein